MSSPSGVWAFLNGGGLNPQTPLWLRQGNWFLVVRRQFTFFGIFASQTHHIVAGERRTRNYVMVFAAERHCLATDESVEFDKN